MAVRGSIATDVQKMQVRMGRHHKREARRAKDIAVEEVKQRTPIGRIVDPETGRDRGPSGRARKSVKGIKPIESGNSIITGAFSMLGYMEDLERGAGPHIIRPKRGIVRSGPQRGQKRREMVRFWSHGQAAFARQVNHPGMPGYHMFARGIVAAERRWGQGAETRLRVEVFRR